MTGLEHLAGHWLGLHTDAKDFQFYQIILRALVVFFALLCMIRLAGRRFLVNRSALDALLTFLIASVMARAINGNTPFFYTLGTGFFLALLYRAVAYLACRFHSVGRWLKGIAEPIVENGKLNEHILSRHHVSKHDLMEDLRLNGNVNDVAEVKLAQLERNGCISVVKK